MTRKIISSGGLHFGISDVNNNTNYSFNEEIQNLLRLIRPLIEDNIGHRVDYITAINYEFCLPILQALNEPSEPSSHLIEAQINDETIIKIRILVGTGEQRLKVLLENYRSAIAHEETLTLVTKKEEITSLSTSQHESENLTYSASHTEDEATNGAGGDGNDTQISGFEFVHSQVISQSGVSSPIPDDSSTIEETITNSLDDDKVNAQYDLESSGYEEHDAEVTPIAIADESKILLGDAHIEHETETRKVSETEENAKIELEFENICSKEPHSEVIVNQTDDDVEVIHVSEPKTEVGIQQSPSNTTELIEICEIKAQEPVLFVAESKKVEEIAVTTEEVAFKEVKIDEYQEVEVQSQDILLTNFQQSELDSQVSSDKTITGESDTLGDESQIKITPRNPKYVRDSSYASTFGDESEYINAYSEFTTTRTVSPVNYDEQFKRRTSPKPVKRTTSKNAAVQFNQQVDTSTQTQSVSKPKIIIKKIITKVRQPRVFRPKLAISDINGINYNFSQELERTMFMVKPLVEQKIGKIILQLQILDYAYALPFVKSTKNYDFNYSHYLKVAIQNEEKQEECILVRLYLDSEMAYRPNVAIKSNKTRSDPIELFY